MPVITVVNVDVQTPAGKRYQVAEVIYKQDGETKTKKIMSFANPAVFATVKEAKTGEVYTFTQEKDEKGYFQWNSITQGAEPSGVPANASAASPGRNPAPSTGRDFETKDERAERQKLIVRQSSLSNAIATLAPGAKTALDPNVVLDLADKYVAWVTAAPDLFFEQENDI
jgi:hypothetical protein